MPNRDDAKLLEGLVRQARKNRLVYRVLAERGLILFEIEAPQPAAEVHDSALGLPGERNTIQAYTLVPPFQPWALSRHPQRLPRTSSMPPQRGLWGLSGKRTESNHAAPSGNRRAEPAGEFFARLLPSP
jgi:hypothetical protein